METGKFYEMTRITGKKIKFKLLSFDLVKRRIETSEVNNKGLLNLHNLTDEEINSMKEIEPNENIEQIKNKF